MKMIDDYDYNTLRKALDIIRNSGFKYEEDDYFALLHLTGLYHKSKKLK